MPRRTVVPNLGPAETGFQLLGAAYDEPTNQPTLIAVAATTQPNPTNPDHVLVYASARQVDGQGRDVKGADRRLVQIPDSVTSVEKNPTTTTLYQEMQDQMAAHAGKFEAALIAVVTPLAAPVAP